MEHNEEKFTIEEASTHVADVKRHELIKQIESLKRFYYEMGYDSDNIMTIFSLTLSYLRGHVNQLVVKSFFDVMMNQSKLNGSKEIDLLNCFDDLIEHTEMLDSDSGYQAGHGYLEAA